MGEREYGLDPAMVARIADEIEAGRTRSASRSAW